MINKLLHTPEGFRDVYGNELIKKSIVKNILIDEVKKYDYMNIDTPTVEFFDVFSSNIGTIPSKELYKFFDKEGNTLVLRPDFTPSIARVAATYFADHMEPLRFMYSGNTFTNSSDLQGRLKEVTEVGCELMNDGSAEADYEIVSMVIRLFKALKIEDFQISIGNVEFFKGLCEEAKVSKETELELREIISEKNFFLAESILNETEIYSYVREAFLSIQDLFGKEDCLIEAEKYAVNARTKESVERLKKIYRLAKADGFDKYITFDFGILSKYNYYTGIVFRGYTYGSGDAVFKGGRYDNLLKEFGKDAPAVGFVANVDQLVEVINRGEGGFNLCDI